MAEASLPERLAAVQERIQSAQQRLGLAPQAVGLVAVSKTHPASSVCEALATGQADFGENYVQEGVQKVAAVRHDAPQGQPRWHFIGPLQSNKTRDVAAHFDWVHTVDRIKIAQRLADQRPDGMAPLQLCLQVNIGDEASKSGVPEAEAVATFTAIAALAQAQPSRIQLRGLMAIPAPGAGLQAFDRLLELLKACSDGVDANTRAAMGRPVASMGMSDDWEVALEAQAKAARAGFETQVWLRIGTAIFGARPSP
ncbi:MAG: YggS family pyridoxal phosphate-dependent enzyme [Burkholderiaceae bacterium]